MQRKCRHLGGDASDDLLEDALDVPVLCGASGTRRSSSSVLPGMNTTSGKGTWQVHGRRGTLRADGRRGYSGGMDLGWIFAARLTLQLDEDR